MFFIDSNDIWFGTFLGYVFHNMINEIGSKQYQQNCGHSFQDRGVIVTPPKYLHHWLLYYSWKTFILLSIPLIYHMVFLEVSSMNTNWIGWSVLFKTFIIHPPNALSKNHSKISITLIHRELSFFFPFTYPMIFIFLILAQWILIGWSALFKTLIIHWACI